MGALGIIKPCIRYLKKMLCYKKTLGSTLTSLNGKFSQILAIQAVLDMQL